MNTLVWAAGRHPNIGLAIEFAAFYEEQVYECWFIQVEGLFLIPCRVALVIGTL